MDLGYSKRSCCGQKLATNPTQLFTKDETTTGSPCSMFSQLLKMIVKNRGNEGQDESEKAEQTEGKAELPQPRFTAPCCCASNSEYFCGFYCFTCLLLTNQLYHDTN